LTDLKLFDKLVQLEGIYFVFFPSLFCPDGQFGKENPTHIAAHLQARTSQR